MVICKRMTFRWITAQFRKNRIINTLFCITSIAVFSVFISFYTDVKKDYCECQFLDCYGQNVIVGDPVIQLKRHISSILLKAANNVKFGKPATAVADLQWTAALLDSRHRYHYKNSRLNKNEDFLNLREYSEHPKILTPFQRNLSENDTEDIQSNFTDTKLGLGEEVLQEKYNYSLQQSLSSLLTVVLDECDNEENNVTKRIDDLLSQIQLYWDQVTVIIINDGENVVEPARHKISIIQVHCKDDSNRSLIEDIISNIKTEFTLFLKSIAAITADIKIFQLLQVATDLKNVGVIGMSERGSDGGWDYTCSQIHHENSQLTLQEGYDYSRGSCIFCDITSNSFLVKTHALRIALPDSNLPVIARHIDWFIRLRQANVLTLTCPEVMVHTTHKVMPNKKIDLEKPCVTKVAKRNAKDKYLALKRIYRKLAQKWELTRINLHNKTLEYNCLEIHFDCRAKTRVRNYILPPCCLKIKNKLFATLHKLMRETLVPYEIKDGTLLGAVKFKDSIPWDFDDDCHYPNKYVEVFKQNKFRMKQLGLSPVFSKITNVKTRELESNYITIGGQGNFDIDLWGVESLDSEASLQKLGRMPGNLPCFQYGHIPVYINNFLQKEDNVTLQVLSEREQIKNQPPQQREINFGKRKKIKQIKNQYFPPIPSKSCYLQSFVRIGEKWVVGPWNPALEATRNYGENLFKHKAHWRFEEKNNSWPSCAYPGHPMCLNIHPLDGSIPFQ